MSIGPNNGNKKVKPLAIVNYDDSDSEDDELALRLSKIHKIIHKGDGLDLGLKSNDLVKRPHVEPSISTTSESGSSQRFVDSTVPLFEKPIKPTQQANLEDIKRPFEFGDRGHTWRQIKLKAFSEQLSNQYAIENIVHERYPEFIKCKKAKYETEDKERLLGQYATLWDVGYILIEKEYLSTPANNTNEVLKRGERFLQIRFQN